MDKTKPFGLVLPKRARAVTAKTNAAFDSDSDDESPAKMRAGMKIPQANPPPLKFFKVELCEDPSIYEYDSIYDDMKAKEVAKMEPKTDKPSRYIDSLLKAADKRKKNYERRLEKKVQAEREKEGDKFKDKEAFVTSAYKKKMQEMEEEEERERRESQLNDMMDVTKQNDLSGFYRHFLKQSVGEEKIPVFGERMDIKKEPGTEPDSEVTVKIEEDATGNCKALDPDLDRDSDIVSSSDDEPADSEKVVEKATSDGSKKSDENHSNDESVNKVKKTKLHRQIRKKTVEDESEDDSETIKPDLARPQRQWRKKTDDDNEDINSNVKNKKSREKKQNAKDSGSDSNSMDDADHEVTEANDSVGNQELSKDGGDDVAETKKVKERKNMFEKRTVGDVFADAQARYFQRMSLRAG